MGIYSLWFYYLTPKDMPNRDGTGPEGKGPRTGRGMGNCPVDEKQDSPAAGRGQGAGRGMGRGAGRGRGRNA